MKMNLLNKWLLGAAICLSMSNCQQLPDDMLKTDNEGVLKVKTRSVENQDVIYPLTLYVFSTDGDCLETLLIEEKDEVVQFRLPEGHYRVVAMSACKDSYSVSTVSSWDNVIRMSDEGGAKIPLLMGNADVTMDSDTKGKLEIVLSNAVTAIDVSLSNVPADVVSVVIAMSPFSSSVNLKGEYVDSDYSWRLPCSLDTNNRWSTKTCYLFPGSGKEIVLSIWMKKKSGEEVTYGYTWKESPEENQPYHLEGDYSDGLSLNGSFVLKAWNEAKDVAFQFGAVSSSDEEEEEEDEDGSNADLPEIGSIWNGTIVANILEKDETGTDMLLMSLEEWEGTASDVKDAEFDYTVNGISDWRLPTHEEAAVLRDKFNGESLVKLNERIAEYDPELYELADGEKERYLCLKNGEVYTFQFRAGKSITSAGEKRTYYVRLVKSYHMDF